MGKPKHDYGHRHVLFRPLWLKGLRRRHRWIFRILVAVPFLLLVVGVIAFRSPLTRILVLPRIEKALNLKVEAESVYLNAHGDLVLNRARMILPTVPGPAGRFLRVGRVTADIDWGSIFRGEVRFRSIELVEPILTVSQSLSDRSLNLGALDLPKSSGTTAIPAISVVNAGVELGEHRGPYYYKSLKHVIVNGHFGPVPGDPAGGYAFTLEQAAAQPGPDPKRGFSISGTLREDGRLSGVVDNFALSNWPPESIPTPIRDIFTDLDLAGDVRRATFSYAPREGLIAEFILHNVGMNVPARQEDDPSKTALMGPPAASMRLHGVDGTVVFARDHVAAKVQGLIEDVPYTVALTYQGTDVNSPFVTQIESKNFRLQRTSAILPYLPPRVNEILGIFSGPTALLNARVTLTRGEPVGSEAAEIRFSGEVEVSEGVAAFDLFPYEFRNLAARVTFNNDRVDIERVTGDSESGATLEAHGYIAPLDDRAEMLIDVNVTGAPIDARMEAAFGPDRQKLVPAIFNQQKHDELVRDDLIRTPEQAAAESAEMERLKGALPALTGEESTAAAAEIARLSARASIPVFPFRGLVNVAVRTHSPKGRGTGWRTQVDIELPRAGVVPERFPLPVIAENIHVRVVDENGQITAGTFRGLGGGTADVEAYFDIPAKDSVDKDAHPEITIAAKDIPLDEFVIHALPGDDNAADGPSQLKPMLRRLRLAGTGDADVRIADRPTPGRPTGFDAQARLTGAQANPEPWTGSGPVSLTDIAGRVDVNEDRLTLDLTGQPAAPPKAVGVQLAEPIGEPVAVHADATFQGHGADARTSVTAAVSAKGILVSAPIESLVGVFSPDGARQVADLRRLYSPSGFIDTATRVECPPGAPAKVEVDLSNPRSLSADALGGRIEIPSAAGIATVAPADHAIHLKDVRSPISFQGVSSGELSLSGDYPIGDAGQSEPAHPPLTLSLRNGLFEAPLVFRILEDRLGRDAAIAFGDYHAMGLFDGEIQLAFPVPGVPPQIHGVITPRTLSGNLSGAPVSLTGMHGEIEFDRSAGKFRNLGGQAANWAGAVDGAWTLKDGGFEVRTQFSLHARTLSEDLRAILPPALRDALHSIDLTIDKRLDVDDASLVVASGEGGRSVHFDGAASFEGAALDLGIPIKGMTGTLHTTLDSPPGDAPPVYALDVDADSFSVAGAYVRNGHAAVRSGERPGEVTLESASGECYGGRLSANAELTVSGDTDAPKRLDADVRFAGVRFAPLLDALTAKPGDEGPLPPDESRDDDKSRGLLDAGLTIGGIVGQPETRRGRGQVRISGGRIISLPLVMELIEVSNFQIPSNSRLDFARGVFYLEGSNMIFEDLAFLSRAIEIVGTGSVAWPSQALDFSFNSRSARPIPVLSTIIQGIRDELITTRVTGVISSPVVTLQQFPGPRRILGRATGATAETRAQAFDRQADAAEARARRKAAGIQPVPAGPQSAIHGDIPASTLQPLHLTSPGTPE